MTDMDSDIRVPFPKIGHDHGVCAETAFARAEELCHARGARLTATRRRVLELIWRSHEPMGAYALLESLRRSKRRAAAPTVYRALDFLMAQGLIHRIESLSAYVGCDHPGESAHGPFLLCTSCGQAFELRDDHLDAAVAEGASRVGFWGSPESRISAMSASTPPGSGPARLADPTSWVCAETSGTRRSRSAWGSACG